MTKSNIVSLTENYEFLRVYRKGKVYNGRLVVIYLLKRRDKLKRLGITATKKVGKACIRNRARRLIYENIRLFMPDIKPGYDIVVVARSSIVAKTFFDVGKEISYFLKKADVFMGNARNAGTADSILT